MLLQNKKAIIYGGGGANRGAAARAFAREGAKVFLAGRTLARLDRVAREISAAGGMAEIAEVDALDETAVETHADAVAAKAGGIDIALNAVGIRTCRGAACLAVLRGLRPSDHGLHPNEFSHGEGGRAAHGEAALRRGRARPLSNRRRSSGFRGEWCSAPDSWRDCLPSQRRQWPLRATSSICAVLHHRGRKDTEVT